MIHLAGPVRSVFAMSERRAMRADVDDFTVAPGAPGSGVTGYLGTSNVTGDLRRFHVFGTKGWVEMRGDTTVVSVGLEGAPKTTTLPDPDKERAVLELFAETVARRAPVTIDAVEVVNGIAALEAIVESAATGRMIMWPERPRREVGSQGRFVRWSGASRRRPRRRAAADITFATWNIAWLRSARSSPAGIPDLQTDATAGGARSTR